jgi:hypothetical protein
MIFIQKIVGSMKREKGKEKAPYKKALRFEHRDF